MFDRFTKVRGDMTESLLKKDCQACRAIGSATTRPITNRVREQDWLCDRPLQFFFIYLLPGPSIFRHSPTCKERWIHFQWPIENEMKEAPLRAVFIY
ncbi:unnamed protein product, partial [Mesorhabditis spiculigera]